RELLRLNPILGGASLMWLDSFSDRPRCRGQIRNNIGPGNTGLVPAGKILDHHRSRRQFAVPDDQTDGCALSVGHLELCFYRATPQIHVRSDPCGAKLTKQSPLCLTRRLTVVYKPQQPGTRTWKRNALRFQRQQQTLQSRTKAHARRRTSPQLLDEIVVSAAT